MIWMAVFVVVESWNFQTDYTKIYNRVNSAAGSDAAND